MALIPAKMLYIRVQDKSTKIRQVLRLKLGHIALGIFLHTSDFIV